MYLETGYIIVKSKNKLLITVEKFELFVSELRCWLAKAL